MKHTNRVRVHTFANNFRKCKMILDDEIIKCRENAKRGKTKRAKYFTAPIWLRFGVDWQERIRFLVSNTTPIRHSTMKDKRFDSHFRSISARSDWARSVATTLSALLVANPFVSFAFFFFLYNRTTCSIIKYFFSCFLSDWRNDAKY